jgi:hypothetical protein
MYGQGIHYLWHVHFQMWDITTGNLIDVLVGRHTQDCITMADLSSNEDLLVLCSTSGSFLLLSLTLSPHPPYMEVQDTFTFQLDVSIRSCKLSHDALLLALGQDNGNISVSILGGGILRKYFFFCSFLPSFFPPSLSPALYIRVTLSVRAHQENWQPQLPRNVTNFKQAIGFQISRCTLRKLMLH